MTSDISNISDLVKIGLEISKTHQLWKIIKRRVQIRKLFFSIAGRFPHPVSVDDAYALLDLTLSKYRDEISTVKYDKIQYDIKIYILSSQNIMDSILYNGIIFPEQLILEDYLFTQNLIEDFKIFISPKELHTLEDLLENSFNFLKEIAQDLSKNHNISSTRYIILDIDTSNLEHAIDRLAKQLKKKKLEITHIVRHYRLNKERMRLIVIYDDYRIVEALKGVFTI